MHNQVSTQAGPQTNAFNYGDDERILDPMVEGEPTSVHCDMASFPP